MSTPFHLKLVHTLSSEPELVYEVLSDFKKFGEIHEYIKVVKLIDASSAEFKEYSIDEEIYLLGFIKNKPHYTVKVYELKKNSHVRYLSPVKKNIQLQIDFTVEKTAANQTRVTEHIQVNAPYLLGAIFITILKKAHLKFFMNFNTILMNTIEDL